MITLLFVCYLFPLHAQKIVMDKAESDGKRYISTEQQTIIYGKQNFWGVITETGIGMSLSCVASNNDTTWGIQLCVHEKVQIDEGRKLLIKLSDNSIITLENIEQIGPLDYETYIGANITVYSVYPLYYVSKNNLLTMLQIGVEKIRIETNIDYIDRMVKGKTMVDVLRAQYDNIQEALSKTKDIYTDF